MGCNIRRRGGRVIFSIAAASLRTILPGKGFEGVAIEMAYLLRVRLAFALTVACVLPAAAQTQTAWPNQAVKFILPVSAGSSTDILARALGDKLFRIWKQPVIVENRPGLAGVSAVAKSAPDGLTMIVVSNGHAAIGVLNKSLSFDPLNDFVGLAQVASVPMLMVTPPEFEAKDLKAFLALARAKPGTLNIASAGPGTSSNIVAELFKAASGIKAVTIHFRGAPEAHISVMRGDSHAYFTSVPAGLEYVRSGKERVLAVSNPERIKFLPEAPTIAEAGLPGFTQGAWYGVLGPAGIPAAVINQINRDISAVVTSPELSANFEREGILPVTTSQTAFDKLFRDETERVGKIFREAGVGAQ